MVGPDEALSAADRLFTAVEKGELEELRNIFAQDAKIWHNTDNRSIDVSTSIRSIRAIQRSATEFRYTDIRRGPLPTGFVQQHVLMIRLANGQLIADRACCICSVVAGRIAHMDAYHDSAVFKAAGFTKLDSPRPA
jgi:ketosteroid isomerase-like protein